MPNRVTTRSSSEAAYYSSSTTTRTKFVVATPGWRELNGKPLHDVVIKERQLLTQEQWDETFSFENLINPKFEM